MLVVILITRQISSGASSLMKEYILPKKVKGAGKITALTTLIFLFLEGLIPLFLRRHGSYFFLNVSKNT